MAIETFTKTSDRTVDFNINIIEYTASIRRFVQDNARHHLAVLLTNPGIKLFFIDKVGAIGFARYNKCLIVIGGLMAEASNKSLLLQKFLSWSDKQKLQTLFIHFPANDISALNQGGCAVNQIGACYGIDTNYYSMTGKRFQQLRYKINKAGKRGITIKEIILQDEFLSIKQELIDINSSWQKVKKSKPIRILVTDFDTITLSDDSNRLFVAYHKGELISYILYSKTWGEDSGWFHNLSRYRQESIDGSMQLINKTFLDEISDEGGYLHFGFTPLVEMGQEHGEGSKAFSRIASYLSNRGGVVYPARSQSQYKKSWRPTYIQPEYLAYRCGPMKALFNLLMATNSI